MSRKGKSAHARAWIAPLLCTALLSPAAVAAQSLLSAGGLGVPIEPLDARARALGGVAIGLFGSSVLPTDPASAADLAVPSMTFTMAGAWVDVREVGAVGDASGARFPALGVSYPLRRWGTATLTYGSVLDQRWQSRQEHRVELGETTADVTDLFVSDGGVASLRVGFARRIAPSLARGPPSDAIRVSSPGASRAPSTPARPASTFSPHSRWVSGTTRGRTPPWGRRWTWRRSCAWPPT